MSISLPMIECSSCGKVLGHLYEDYYNLGALLERLSQENDALSLANSDHTEDFRTPNSHDNWNEFIKPYFRWLVEHPDDRDMYTPHNIVARSLLRPYGEVSRMPINLRVLGKPLLTDARYCCLRMFMTDNSRATY